MFDSIAFRRKASGPIESPIDLGMLVEAMLFYGSTSVIADRETLGFLLKSLGPDVLVALLSERLFRVFYVESLAGIKTEKDFRGAEIHEPVIMTSPQHTASEEIRKICIEAVGKDGKGRRLARRIEPLIRVVQHDQMVIQGVRESILNSEYLDKAVQHVTSALVPETRNRPGYSKISRKDFHWKKSSAPEAHSVRFQPAPTLFQ